MKVRPLAIIFFIIPFCLPKMGCTQLDSTSVHRFAKFLEASQEYEFAAEEYERLYFLHPNTIHFFTNAVKNYRLAGKIDRIEHRILNQPFDDKALVYYILSKIDQEDYSSASQILDQRKIDLESRFVSRLDLDLLFYQGKYKDGRNKYMDYLSTDNQYLLLIDEGLSLNQKSPAVAGLLSGILPGLGRFYHIVGMMSNIKIG